MSKIVRTDDWTQGDRLFPFGAQLLDAAGQPLDLSGLTVAFRMAWANSPRTVKVDSAAATIDNAGLGYVSYAFQAADVDTAATYNYWWIVSDGETVEHYPKDGDTHVLRIVPAL